MISGDLQKAGVSKKSVEGFGDACIFGGFWQKKPAIR
jgi:hypothetical protein